MKTIIAWHIFMTLAPIALGVVLGGHLREGNWVYVLCAINGFINGAGMMWRISKLNKNENH